MDNTDKGNAFLRPTDDDYTFLPLPPRPRDMYDLEGHAELERLRVTLRRLRAGLEPDAGYYHLSLSEAREIIDQALGEGLS